MSALLLAFYGIIVSLISFFFFYLLGTVVLPRSFAEANDIRRHQIKTTTTFFPVFAGAAFFSIVCWLGIQWGFSLYHTIGFIMCLGVVLGITRVLFSRKCPKITCKKSLFWLGAYILFYGLLYLTAPLPDLKKYLPLTWTYNVDILNYINVTHYFISPSLNPNGDFFWSFYYQTPAVFYFFGWMSVFFHQNAMMAAMPMLYSTGAGIGLMIVFYCNDFFDCPRKIAVIIAALILSGSFYRFVIDLYFLSSLLGCVVWLAFLIEILTWDMKAVLTPRLFGEYALIIFVYQALLLLLYPVLFMSMLIIFCIVMVSKIYFTRNTIGLSGAANNICLHRFFFFLGCISVVTLTLFILLPGYFQHSIHNLYEFGHRKGIMGLSFLSPAATLALPCFFVDRSSISYSYISSFIGCCTCFAGLLSAVYFGKISLKPAANVMIFLMVGAWGAYGIYYLLQGEGYYQPWKFASYFILPLGAVCWSLVFRLMLSEKIFMAVLLFFILANFLFIPIKHHVSLSKGYEKLAQLNRFPEKDLYIKMLTPESTFLAVFFVQDKKLHLLSPTFYYYPQWSSNNIPQHARLFEETLDKRAD